MKLKAYHKSIRKPQAPPTKVFRSDKDYDRRQNAESIEEAISEPEEGSFVSGCRK